jgi:serine protease Do
MSVPSFQLGSRKLVAALLTAGVLGGVGASALQHVQWSAHAQGAPAVVAQAAPAAAPMVSLPNFSTITQQAGPAVVNISVRGTRKVSDDEDDGDDADAAPSANRGQQIDPNDPMLQFFRQFGFGVPPGAARGADGR